MIALRATAAKLTLCAVVLALALGAAACSSDSGSSGPSSTSRRSGTTTSSQPPLTGTNWVLTAGASLTVPASGTTVTARFDSGTVAGQAPCNSYSAQYDVTGSAMAIGPDIRTTLVACSGAAGTLEQGYLRALPEVTQFAISGSTLTLSSANEKALLVYRATVGAKEIVGAWTVTGYYTGTAIRSVVVGSDLSANFAPSDVSGDSGCNTFTGPYETQGDAIRIGPLASTLRACADPAVATQEQQYQAALALASTYQVSGNRLDLLRADGGIAVTLNRTAPK